MLEQLGRTETPAKIAERKLRESELIALVSVLVRELHPQRVRFIDVQPSSRVERDLGIDSLGRTELMLRVERAFRVRLPAQTIGEAEIVNDPVQALEKAGPTPERMALASPTVSALPSVPAAVEARTLLEVLDWHAARHPGRQHLTVLQDEATILGTLTYGELAIRAHKLAHGLIARDVVPGDRVALMLPTSIDFFIAFFGILYAGAIPVPIYPPMRLSQLEDHLRRQIGILRNAGACMLITMPEGQRLAGLLRAQVETLTAVESVTGVDATAAPVELPQVKDPDSVALIQYTSGSTGDPKGVVLSHANLLANIRAMGGVMDASSADVFVSWLPLYHDMGLIGAWLGCLHHAATLYAMSPLSFLVRPESWLWAIHRFRATFSASPNFGFELCLNKIDDANLEGLDLSSLRMVANEVYITGRVKDIIIRAGRHLYPQEIEEAVADIPGIRKGGVAVFGVTDQASGTERVVVLAETREADPAARAALQTRAHEVTTDIAGTPPDEIVLAPPRTVPKTSSGKIRRSAAKALYESGHIGPVQPPVWWQLLRLGLSGTGPQIRRLTRLLSEAMYAAWWWVVLAAAFLLGSLTIIILPRLAWRWSALRWISRGTLAAMGVPVSISGIDRIPDRGAMLTFNHSSYMDSLVLVAVLPGEPAIVAKRELAGQSFAGPLLRRLAIPFVERYDVSGSLADAEALIAHAHQGRTLVFFPEGTFTRRAGLSGFYLGAFKVAAEAELEILPGVIRGTRSLLRSDQWFPRHAAISVEIGEPVMPSGADFTSVLHCAMRCAMLC